MAQQSQEGHSNKLWPATNLCLWLQLLRPPQSYRVISCLYHSLRRTLNMWLYYWNISLVWHLDLLLADTTYCRRNLLLREDWYFWFCCLDVKRNVSFINVSLVYRLLSLNCFFILVFRYFAFLYACICKVHSNILFCNKSCRNTIPEYKKFNDKATVNGNGVAYYSYNTQWRKTQLTAWTFSGPT